MLYFLLIPAAAVYLHMGAVLSMTSTDIWCDEIASENVPENLKFFHFPLSALGWWKRRTLLEIVDLGKTGVFSFVLLMFVWPLKVIWNTVIILIVIGPACLIGPRLHNRKERGSDAGRY